jgi:hypothetical protein
MSTGLTQSANGFSDSGFESFGFEERTSATAGSMSSYISNVDPVRKQGQLRRTEYATGNVRPLRDPATTYAINRYLEAGLESISDLAGLLSAGEFMDAALVGYEIEELLASLWGLRDRREEDFGDVINLLQGALRKEDYEAWDTGRCDCLTFIFSRLGDPVTSDHKISMVTRMVKSGIDPLKGISSDPTDADATRPVP